MSNLLIGPNSLAGQTVVLTGKVLGIGRRDMFRTINQAGGIAADKVDANTTLLVVAGGATGAQTTKFKAAARRGLPIISDAIFRGVIEGQITVQVVSMMTMGTQQGIPKAAKAVALNSTKRELRQRASAGKQLDQLAASKTTGLYGISF